MLLRIPSGLVRLVRWRDRGSAEDAIPLRGDLLRALAFARRLGATPGARTAFRALLEQDLCATARAHDEEVLRQFAARLASGRVVALRVPTAPVASAGFGRDVVPEDVLGPAPDAAVLAPTAWIEILLVDAGGSPVAGERYQIEFPDGTSREGRLDATGRAYFDAIQAGKCKVRFPELDKDAVARPAQV